MGFEACNEELPRKSLVMFFLIDASGGMHGEKIGTINETMRELLPKMEKISDSNADVVLKLAVMQFSYDAKWVTQFPVEFGDYSWMDLEADGTRSLGEACELLNEKLSKKEFLNDKVGYRAPIIILLSGGEPTDDFYSCFDVLKKNNWFQHAIKAAIGIGFDNNEKILSDFTGSEETVVYAQNAAMLKKMIKSIPLIAVRSGQIVGCYSEVQKRFVAGIQESVENAEVEGITEIPGII